MPSHEPTEKRVNTVTVECTRTGSERYSLEYAYQAYTLADVEAWCAELRKLGAGDDLELDQADGLVVTLDGQSCGLAATREGHA